MNLESQKHFRLVLIVANSNFTCLESYSMEDRDVVPHCFLMKSALVCDKRCRAL